MAKGFAPRIRFWMLALCILFGYGAIGYRLVELHVIDGPGRVAEIQSNRNRVIPLNSRRGDIFSYDLNGGRELFATSQTFLEVGVDPVSLKESDLVKLPQLSRVLGLELGLVENVFGARNGRFTEDESSRSDRWRLLRRRVDESTYQTIVDLKITGLYGTRQYERVYPKDSLGAHLIGFIGGNGDAESGIEKEFDFYLSGQRGWRESEVTAGREMAQFRRRLVPSRDGMSLALSIDSYVQYSIEEELKLIAEKYKPESATVIVSDPHTGFIIGLSNYPTFDPNHYSEYEISSHRNRALTDPLEPGSTFKIVAASSALEEGLVSIYDEFDCSIPTLRMPTGYVARLPKDWKPFGVLSVEGIVTNSSNRGAAHLGTLVGYEEFYDYVRRFGFGERTGLNLGVESRGIVHPVNKWDGLTLSRMTMGHSLSATPLQIHNAMATIANGGLLMRSQIVTKILDTNNKETVSFGKMVRRRVISRETARTMSQLLVKTASLGGTAHKAAIPGYLVAGKTGTAQKLVDGRFSSRHHTGSFSGYFPADDPEFVITVIVDGSTIGMPVSGSGAAIPSFKRIAEKLIPYYAITPIDSNEAFAMNADVSRLAASN
ncbi:MAG: cell division protein FtsI/penicillin-binding protein 2 [Candidatus Pelagisphaera sp.]|jgi:cell division protein FtsI/penicillin-binding protein 2